MAAEHRPDPVIDWRVWNVSDDGSGPVLLPAGSGTDEWPTRRPLEARCTVPRVLSAKTRGAIALRRAMLSRAASSDAWTCSVAYSW